VNDAILIQVGDLPPTTAVGGWDEIRPSEFAIVLDQTREDEIDADRLATRMLENDEDKRLLIGLSEGATAVLIYDRLMNSISRTPIEINRVDDNGSRHIDRRRTEGQVLRSVQQLGSDYFNWV
jgi:hypothetical protein